MLEAINVEVVQNMDLAIPVMQEAGKWLQESGKNPSKWWLPENLNPKFLLQYAKEHEFYAAIANDKLAAAAIFQLSQSAQNWHNIDIDNPQPALYIHWLCVSRTFAGQGLPKIMIDFAAGLAKENNIQLLRADTNAEIIKLRKIYENLGFSLVSIEDEDYRRTAFYQKKL